VERVGCGKGGFRAFEALREGGSVSGRCRVPQMAEQ